jgi:hypothetical protein
MTTQLRHLPRPTSTARVGLLTKPQLAPTIVAVTAFAGRTAIVGLGGALLMATGALHGTAVSVAIVGVIGIAVALLTWGE